jgi:hypothetical protein
MILLAYLDLQQQFETLSPKVRYKQVRENIDCGPIGYHPDVLFSYVTVP